MKRILYVLIVVILLSSCKKEKLYNCMSGDWGTNRTTVEMSINSNGYERINGYNINNSGDVYIDGIKQFHFDCSQDTLYYKQIDANINYPTIKLLRIN